MGGEHTKEDRKGKSGVCLSMGLTLDPSPGIYLCCQVRGQPLVHGHQEILGWPWWRRKDWRASAARRGTLTRAWLAC